MSQKRFKTYRYSSSANRQVQNAKPVKRKYIFPVIIIAAVIGVFGVSKFVFSGGDPDSRVDAAAQKAPSPTPVSEAQLSEKINAVISANPSLDIGVAVRDIKTGQSYTYGVENPFIAASTSKILSAALYLKQVESGQRSLDEWLDNATAKDHIDRMISVSDNNSWHIINDSVGKDTLQAYATENGLASYNSEDNTIVPAEVAKLLDDVYQRKLLNEEHSKIILSAMKDSQEEMQFIRNYVEPETTVYHKAGWLADRAHDTAIIENGDRPFVLVVFTKKRFGPYDFDKGQTIFSQLTKSTLEVFRSI